MQIRKPVFVPVHLHTGALYAVLVPLALYAIAALLTYWAGTFGTQFFHTGNCVGSGMRHHYDGEWYANWDGQWYKKLVEEGYSYTPDRQSSTAFYPFYPLLGSLASRAFGLRAELALLAVAHIFCLGTFLLLFRYCRERFPEQHLVAHYTLVALAAWPMALFQHMAYTESAFLFLFALILTGVQRRWHWAILALIAGAAVGTRSVGIVLALFALQAAWQAGGATPKRVLTLAAAGALSLWGLLAFMLFLSLSFDEPFAFSKTMPYWGALGEIGSGEYWWRLLTFERLRGYLWQTNWGAPPVFSNFWITGNTVFWLVPLIAVWIGAWKRAINRVEALVCLGLLFIPYVTHGDTRQMMSMGRYASVALPFYWIIGGWLARLPAAIAAGLTGVMFVASILLAAMFAAWYCVL